MWVLFSFTGFDSDPFVISGSRTAIFKLRRFVGIARRSIEIFYALPARLRALPVLDEIRSEMPIRKGAPEKALPSTKASSFSVPISATFSSSARALPPRAMHRVLVTPTYPHEAL
jgi:hypothetical protein